MCFHLLEPTRERETEVTFRHTESRNQGGEASSAGRRKTEHSTSRCPGLRTRGASGILATKGPKWPVPKFLIL